VSVVCAILRDGFEDYLADRLPAPQRRILREHLAVCETCRVAAAARDASLAFARAWTAAGEDVTPVETAAILASVRTGVAHIEAERRVRAGRWSRRSAASAAAVAASLALLVLTLPGGSRHETSVAALPAPAETSPRAGAPPAGSGLEAAGLPVEAAVPSSATVYELNPGAAQDEPRVVWIVDRGLDI